MLFLVYGSVFRDMRSVRDFFGHTPCPFTVIKTLLRYFWLLDTLIKGDKTSLYDRMGYWDSSYKEISVDDSLRHGILIPQIPFESIGEGKFLNFNSKIFS